jgi:hypothetical protein
MRSPTLRLYTVLAFSAIRRTFLGSSHPHIASALTTAAIFISDATRPAAAADEESRAVADLTRAAAMRALSTAAAAAAPKSQGIVQQYGVVAALAVGGLAVASQYPRVLPLLIGYVSWKSRKQTNKETNEIGFDYNCGAVVCCYDSHVRCAHDDDRHRSAISLVHLRCGADVCGSVAAN